MKRFFELSISSRKTVKGEVCLTAETFSTEEEKLGKLVVTLLNGESNGGIFFKYIPNEAGNSGESIALIRLIAENQSNVQKTLKAFKDAIHKKIFEKPSDDPIAAIITGMLISICIEPEKGQIRIPDIFDIHITNELIFKYIGDEWIGIEAKFLPEIQDIIRKLVDKKLNKK